jgi:hypothetical protein
MRAFNLIIASMKNIKKSTMKRFLLITATLALLAGGFSSCKKTIANTYLNPELSTTGSMSKLMSGMFLNKRIHPSYYDFATFILPTTGAFSQETSLAPGAQMYEPSIAYNEARWEDYYDGSMPSAGNSVDYNYDGPGILNSYREIQTTYAALSPADQANQLVFMQCAKVLMYDQTAQMVDLWGDIPFSKANSLNTASRSLSYAPFDNQVAVYDSCIAGLQALNTWFASATLSTEIQAELTQQDILLNGSLIGWQRYANSLLLRLLMRTSFYDETTSKTLVTAMLADPATYPLITDNSMNVALQESPTALKSDLQSALAPSGTGNGAVWYAPAYLLDTIMVANGDPRTAVYWDSVAGQPYVGFPVDGTDAQYATGGFAVYDSATFIYNYNVPGVVFTAAEVYFLMAEANVRWGAGSTPASQSYANGVTQSVNWYYSINQAKQDKQGYSAASLPTPGAAVIQNYLTNSGMAWTTAATPAQQLNLIGTQNWINFFILQAGQAWAEYKRTGYPALTFYPATLAGYTQPPNRLLYPTSEQLYNSVNYAAEASKDLSSTKVFWDVN